MVEALGGQILWPWPRDGLGVAGPGLGLESCIDNFWGHTET